jgi:uncharacterized protein YebE (UPF0316 family)
MVEHPFIHSQWFAWVGIPLLIFLARICDVSVGTLRIMFIGRGKKAIAPFLGFFEVLIWLIAISQIMQHLTMPFYYVAYAAGYATGTFVGMFIEEKLAVGMILVRVVSSKDSAGLIEALAAGDYGVTSVPAQGARGQVSLVHTIIKRSDLAAVIEIVTRFDPQVFYTIEDVRRVNKGIFPTGGASQLKCAMDGLRNRRKGT